MVKHLAAWRRVSMHCAMLTFLLAVVACSAQHPANTAQPPAHVSSSGQQYRLTYVAVGASDAYGVGTNDPDRLSWPTRLSNALGFRVHLINLGIPGVTVAQAQQIEQPIAIAAQPDIITVWLAVNDFAAGIPLAAYEQQLRALLTALGQGTHARIFVGNLPNLTLLPYFGNQDPTVLLSQVQQWNAGIAAICAATDTHLVDIFSRWGELADRPEYISGDGLHPSDIGAQRLATLFATVIHTTP
jgi:lysophospholipase L1-like esterase